MPQILSLFTCILYYQIGLLLFKGKKKNTDLFFCLILLLDFYSYTIYTAATFLFTRTYEGKSILANVIHNLFKQLLFLFVFYVDRSHWFKCWPIAMDHQRKTLERYFILPSVYHAEFHHMCIISP